MPVIPRQAVHDRAPGPVGAIGEARMVRVQGVARLQRVVGNVVEFARVARKPGDVLVVEDDDSHGDVAEFRTIAFIAVSPLSPTQST